MSNDPVKRRPILVAFGAAAPTAASTAAQAHAAPAVRPVETGKPSGRTP